MLVYVSLFFYKKWLRENIKQGEIKYTYSQLWLCRFKYTNTNKTTRNWYFYQYENNKKEATDSQTYIYMRFIVVLFSFLKHRAHFNLYQWICNRIQPLSLASSNVLKFLFFSRSDSVIPRIGSFRNSIESISNSQSQVVTVYEIMNEFFSIESPIPLFFHQCIKITLHHESSVRYCHVYKGLDFYPCQITQGGYYSTPRGRKVTCPQSFPSNIDLLSSG